MMKDPGPKPSPQAAVSHFVSVMPRKSGALPEAERAGYENISPFRSSVRSLRTESEKPN